jgi:uncharacterized membrane protein
VLIAVVGAAVMHWTQRRQSMDRAEERLISMCEERARMLQEQFGVTVNHVHAIAILIATFNYEKSPPAIDAVRNHSTPLLRRCSCRLQCRGINCQLLWQWRTPEILRVVLRVVSLFFFKEQTEKGEKGERERDAFVVCRRLVVAALVV